MKKEFLISLVVGFLLVSCSTLQVTSDWDSSVDFTQYETFEYYGWAEESDQLMNDFDKKRIETAFGNEFSKRNLEYVEGGGDLIVTLFIVVKEKTQKTASTTHMGGYGGYYGRYYGYGPGWGWGMGHSSTVIDEYDYNEGTLVVDIFDAKEKKLIWEGIGKNTIDENPQARERNIPKAVEAIMKQFPIKPVQ
ncbi:DUF4136 domain-containing protein [Carboxylicivirga sp. N1Y90]|uniref:DUF4136 domain-containing protein n=1 Tax=Carboxylicivirga fragile TaxID=3417571 RepID=UPI003D349288|nr:DUF4136 domain-containing protein [Marinilabiliaceae bacterium N1Y90]